MKNKSAAFQFNALFLISYGVCAVGTTQIIPYLSSMGFQDMQKGYILSGMAIFTLLSQFIFGYLSDKFKSVKKFFLLCFIVYFIFNGILFFFKLNQFWYLFLVVSLVGGLSRTWQGQEDTWVLQTKEVAQDYSRIRAYGAFGWAIGSWTAAGLLHFFDFQLLSYLIWGLSFVTLFFSLKIKEVHRATGKVIKIKDLKELVQSKRYVILVLLLLVLFGMGTADMYIVVDKILAIGGSSFHVGAKWGLQSLMEVPILLAGNKLLKKFKPINLMLFATVMFGFRFVIYAWIQDPWWMIAAAVMQLITFPIVIFCSKVMIDECTSEKIKSSGQMMAMSVYMGISLLVMPILCSWLAQQIGFDNALYVVACFSLAAIGLIFLYKKAEKQAQQAS